MQPSVTFTPTIIHQFPQIDQTLVPVSFCTPRFRKILPKLDPNDATPNNSDIKQEVVPSENVQNLQNVQNVQTVQNGETVQNTSQNPYIIIIPRIDPPKTAIPNNVRLPRVSKKKPILRITINKICNTDNGGTMPGIPREEMSVNMRGDEVEKDTEQVEIKNYKLNRSVVFTLDPITGEILVTKRAIRNTCADEVSQDIV